MDNTEAYTKKKYAEVAQYVKIGGVKKYATLMEALREVETYLPKLYYKSPKVIEDLK